MMLFFLEGEGFPFFIKKEVSLYGATQDKK